MMHTQQSPIRSAVALAAIALTLTAMSGCLPSKSKKGSAYDPTPHVITSDIEQGIRSHIDTLTREGGGYFPLEIKGEKHQLRLVKIHTEYLATLGPHEHFACVDLVDTKGDVYDVDFFMHGDPGTMTVTETLPHKVNGKPYYFWQQNPDKTWGRVPVDEASQKLMGVLIPKDKFEFRYRAFLPKLSGPAKLWIPLPTSDSFQRITLTSIDAPGKHRILTETTHGNKILYWELNPGDGNRPLEIRYDVVRTEKSAYEANPEEAARYLEPEALVPNDPRFEATARKVTAGKTTDLQRARALYDFVIDDLRYAKAGDGWGQGNATFACDARHGNCTDYHAYFIALARAIGIPARFAIGAAIPSSRDEGGVDGYHCWVEFYTDGKWWPVDISEADKYSALATYYFGHHPANRVEFSRGRDLVVEPGPTGGPINFLAYPVLEVEGQPVKTRIEFSFRRDV